MDTKFSVKSTKNSAPDGGCLDSLLVARVRNLGRSRLRSTLIPVRVSFLSSQTQLPRKTILATACAKNDRAKCRELNRAQEWMRPTCWESSLNRLGKLAGNTKHTDGMQSGVSYYYYHYYYYNVCCFHPHFH